MRVAVGLHQFFLTQCGIYLGGGKTAMPEQFLDDPQIRTTAEQIRGKGVAEHMRGHAQMQNAFRQTTNNPLYGSDGEAATPTI